MWVLIQVILLDLGMLPLVLVLYHSLHPLLGGTSFSVSHGGSGGISLDLHSLVGPERDTE